jgi:hypothetical protein
LFFEKIKQLSLDNLAKNIYNISSRINEDCGIDPFIRYEDKDININLMVIFVVS